MNGDYYFCRCPQCGWKGSSEFLGGGGQIADTGDYDDVCCPICYNWDLEDIDPPDTEKSIPKNVMILQTALLRCEYVFRKLAGDCKTEPESWTIEGYAEDCKRALKLAEKARVKDR